MSIGGRRISLKSFALSQPRVIKPPENAMIEMLLSPLCSTIWKIGMIEWNQANSNTFENRTLHLARRSDEKCRGLLLQDNPFTEQPLISEKTGRYWYPPYERDSPTPWKFDAGTCNISDNAQGVSVDP